MKAKLFAYITVFGIFLFVICNTVFLDITLGEFANEVNLINTAEAASEFKAQFEKKEIFISLTVSHDDLTNIEEEVAELVGAFSVNDTEEAEIIKNRLKSSLEHLRRLSGFNLDSII